MKQDDPLSIRQLQVFVALVEQGSFTRAARHLGLSQSTVSGHMADLEKRLGLRLVGRERAGVEPTGAGEVLLKPAREALRAERHARMAAAELTGLLQGRLTLGGSTIPAVYVLPRLLRGFTEQFPGVTVDMITGDSSDIVQYVESGEVDVGCVGERPRGRDLALHEVGHDELALVVPPEHPLIPGGVASVEDVMAHPLVLRERGSGTRRAMLSAMGLDEAEEGLHVSCHVGSTEAVKAAVRSGLGISMVSNLAVADEVKAGALSVVPVRGVRAQRSFWLVTRSEDEITPAGRTFVSHVLGQ